MLSAFVDADRFSVGESHRKLHSQDISAHRGTLPAGVIWPVSTQEVSKILSFAYERNIPITPWGAGTSTEGNPIPMRGGLVLDLTRMNRILEINEEHNDMYETIRIKDVERSQDLWRMHHKSNSL